MVENCKGCGEELTSLRPALSRYGHGDICPDCGLAEAISGDFISKYGSEFSLGYPRDFINESDSILRNKPMKEKLLELLKERDLNFIELFCQKGTFMGEGGKITGGICRGVSVDEVLVFIHQYDARISLLLKD